MSFDVQDFEKEVVQRSYTVPVVVDFWAEWCGPCRVIGPVLERLESESGERWFLAKLNTEQHPQIAEQYGIRSIPNVKLFVDGSATHEFVGAIPDFQIQQWLQQALPHPFRRQLAVAEAFIAEGKLSEAAQLLEEALSKDPDDEATRTTLARTIMVDQPHRAASLVETVDDPKFFDIIEAVQIIAHLAEVNARPDLLPLSDVREGYRKAIQFLFAQQFERALEHFINVIRDDRNYDDDGSRKACLAVFKYLGDEHETTLKYRREFSSALY